MEKQSWRVRIAHESGIEGIHGFPGPRGLPGRPSFVDCRLCRSHDLPRVFADEENDAQYHNPAYNELIRRAKSTNDEAQRMAYMHQAEQMLFDDCVIIPIYYTTQPYVAQPYIKGYHWSQLGLVDFKNAYIDDEERT